ncbi:MAG TPA: hypothetical protein VJG64_03340 [Candidatus Paceibacterota bacterium]
MTNERTYQIVIAVLVFIIVVGGWWVVVRNRDAGLAGIAGSTMATTSDAGVDAGAGDSAALPTSSASVPSGGSTMPAGGEAVQVFDQVAGMSIAVQSVTLDQPSWVAVRDAGGRILGAGWFPVGTQSQVTVSLLRGTVAGERYQVLLYADDGDKKFDWHKDALITEAGGSVAGTTFTAK